MIKLELCERHCSILIIVSLLPDPNVEGIIIIIIIITIIIIIIIIIIVQ